MSHDATVRLRLGAEAARTAQASLAPDNEGFLDSRVEGDDLVLTAEADSLMGLLRSLDDALGCLRATGLE